MLEFLLNTVFNPEKTYTIFLIGMLIASFIILYCVRDAVVERCGEADYGEILPYPIVVAAIAFVPVFQCDGLDTSDYHCVVFSYFVNY